MLSGDLTTSTSSSSSSTTMTTNAAAAVEKNNDIVMDDDDNDDDENDDNDEDDDPPAKQAPLQQTPHASTDTTTTTTTAAGVHAPPGDDDEEAEDADDIEEYIEPNKEPLKEYHDTALQPRASECASYTVTPLVSAVHPCSVYSMAITKNMKWLLTGGDDGFIRKYDFIASMNGEQSLTLVQKHGLDISIQKGGVLLSAWEVEEVSVTSNPVAATPTPPQSDSPVLIKTESSSGIAAPPPPQPPPPSAPAVPALPTINFTSPSKWSAVHSLDVHSEGVWCLAGIECGNINLYTVRYDEGTCHHVLKSHEKPVSVLKITPDEKGVLSGSWDKRTLLWDLNTGAIVREFPTSNTPVTAISYQPSSSPAIATDGASEASPGSVIMITSFDGSVSFIDLRTPESIIRKVAPVGVPPWALSSSWSWDGQRFYVGRRNGTFDEFDFAEGRLMRNIRLPRESGPVSSIRNLPNDRHILCGSNDNIRVYDLHHADMLLQQQQAAMEMVDSSAAQTDADAGPVLVPFTLVPGHHGGSISNIFVDSSARYMISTAGNRGWEGTSNNLCLFYSITPVG